MYQWRADADHDSFDEEIPVGIYDGALSIRM